MNILGPTKYPRLNEGLGLVFLALGVLVTLSLISYNPADPSWNTAAPAHKPSNLIGAFGAHSSDFLLQAIGLAAFLFPVFLLLWAWHWIRSRRVQAQWVKIFGCAALTASVCTAFALAPEWRPLGGTITLGGLAGTLLASYLISAVNLAGAVVITAAVAVLSLYLVSSFSLALVVQWLNGPASVVRRWMNRWQSWLEVRAHRREQLRRESRMRKLEKQKLADSRSAPEVLPGSAATRERHPDNRVPPWENSAAPTDTPEMPRETEIPIHALDDYAPVEQDTWKQPVSQERVPELVERKPLPMAAPVSRKLRAAFSLPPTSLLQEPPGKLFFDKEELKEIAVSIKSKFEEFNVLGSVVQINPGPVVTTFEYKPEAGIKYSRITTLTEDLCLGLQAESILIERIPGKPTVGIEVPNSRREVISLRQILESDEFAQSASPMTMSLGKDISGHIKVASLETMPHLLIAGSTGSGKSVMLNTLIMSLLYKSTPDEVRMIMVDPKRVELGIYEGIPHLLTPVITDARKATNALRNAVLEMERRLKLLASQGVRNIEQFNRKLKAMQQVPRTLFEEVPEPAELLEPLPYILILIDELADLMMLERANVEESVTRLAQMARAVGMHLVLATQRPSVDVITGLIKANFPARISFRVATRVDSRTVLDVMGAEHLLGKGDMLFLPPGSSRLTRVHGAYVTESEIERVVEFWKEQARPEYDDSFLMAPPSDEEGAGDDGEEEFDGAEDPMYQDAVRVVLEMGKASTSTLQRRLRLGYGRAARILDMMQREGIIGPPDGSRPREVLKRPDWLAEIDHQMR